MKPRHSSFTDRQLHWLSVPWIAWIERQWDITVPCESASGTCGTDAYYRYEGLQRGYNLCGAHVLEPVNGSVKHGVPADVLEQARMVRFRGRTGKYKRFPATPAVIRPKRESCMCEGLARPWPGCCATTHTLKES